MLPLIYSQLRHVVRARACTTRLSGGGQTMTIALPSKGSAGIVAFVLNCGSSKLEVSLSQMGSDSMGSVASNFQSRGSIAQRSKEGSTLKGISP